MLGQRALAFGGVALVAAASAAVGLAASAKFGVVLLAPRAARVGRPVTVRIRASERLPTSCNMRIVAIAPGVARETALDAFVNGGYGVQETTGYSFHRLRPTPRLGFLMRPRRSSASTWTATAAFPRPGRWQLAVPNWCAGGYATPLPALRDVTVR